MRQLGLLGLTISILCQLFPVKMAMGADGELDAALIKKMQAECSFNGPWKAIYNALLKNDIKNLALDQDKIRAHQDLFNVTTKAKGVTNQKSSGRCWLFASLNLLRPAMIEEYKLNSFEFSQNDLAFWDKL